MSDIDYSKTIIYVLYWKENKFFIYIGGTTQSIDERLRQHIASAKNLDTKVYNFMREKGRENFDIMIHFVYFKESKTCINGIIITVPIFQVKQFHQYEK